MTRGAKADGFPTTIMEAKGKGTGRGRPAGAEMSVLTATGSFTVFTQSIPAFFRVRYKY